MWKLLIFGQAKKEVFIKLFWLANANVYLLLSNLPFAELAKIHQLLQQIPDYKIFVVLPSPFDRLFYNQNVSIKYYNSTLPWYKFKKKMFLYYVNTYLISPWSSVAATGCNCKRVWSIIHFGQNYLQLFLDYIMYIINLTQRS